MLSAPPLTPARQQMLVQQITKSIKTSALFARKLDPATRGRISHTAFCGGLEIILREVFRQTCGADAAEAVDAAFTEAFDDTTPDALAVIAQAEMAA
jgi:hypothetical protein